LKLWLQKLFPRVDFWISTRDLEPGVLWRPELEKQLREHEVGIVCVTAEDVNKTWPAYEAGGLYKGPGCRVIPYLVEVPVSALVSNPIGGFKFCNAHRQGTFELAAAINKIGTSEQYPEEVLKRAFETWWRDFIPELEAAAWHDDFDSFFGPMGPDGQYPAVFLNASLETLEHSETDPCEEQRGGDSEVCAVRVWKWPAGAENARPKGIRQIVPYQELEVMLMLDREFRKYSRRVEIRLDDFHPGEYRPLPPYSCLSVGLGFNNLTVRLGAESGVYTVQHDQPVKGKKHTTDYFTIMNYGTKNSPIEENHRKVIDPGAEVESDEEWALIARVLVCETDHTAPVPVLVCAGHTADGTMEACRYVAQRWRTDIWNPHREVLQDHHMALILAHRKYPRAASARLLNKIAFRYARQQE
jgi:hypothetical protein